MDTSQEAFQTTLVPPAPLLYLPVFSHIGRKTKQRSVENPGQEKHGNISFLLTQEFGSHLREVALIFRRKPSAIRFTHVEYRKKNYLLMNPK